MALKAVLSKADYDALPEAVKAFYVEDGGKFVLDAEIEEHPKVGGLKSALEKERKDKTNANAEFRKLKEQIGDLDPEKAREALARIQELTDKKLLDEGKVEELIQARTDRMRKDHEGQVAAFQTKEKEAATRITKLQGRLKSLRVDGSIREKALERGVKPEHIEDVIGRMTMRGIDGIRWDLQEDEKGDTDAIVALVGDQVKYGKDANQPMSIDEGLDLLRSKVPGFFQASSGGGASSQAGNVNKNGQHVISRVDAKDPRKFAAAEEAAAKAGQTLQIAQE